MKLLIVESPVKVKTISNFLNTDKLKEWRLCATLGHIVDLPVKRHGLKLENGVYQAEWETIEGKGKIIQELKRLVKEASEVYIATDDDREGEKIADDIVHYCGLKEYYRVVFHEITKTAVIEGIKNARLVSKQVVLAQNARRFIDREIGYKVSEIIRQDFRNKGKEISPNIGVGRVVSPALHLLVQQEKEILEFISEKQYKIFVDYQKDGNQFRVTHPTIFDDNTKMEMMEMILEIGNRRNNHIVEVYKASVEDVRPYPPLITSRLLRGCSYTYGFKPKDTMKLAQRLFESGLITYTRTDSYYISDDAIVNIIRYLNTKFDENDVLQSKRTYKQKQGSHDAHEAIRPIHFIEEYEPTNIINTDEFQRNNLTEDHRKVYEFIWYVTLATQMRDSQYDRSSVQVRVGMNLLQARANSIAKGETMNGEIVDMLGWEKLRGTYLKTAERDSNEDYQDRIVYLPILIPGEQLEPINVSYTEYQSKRPPRYGVGRFITVLEEKGIGRPSTFASIYEKLINTGCVQLINNQMLQPTYLGLEIDGWISEYCPWMSDIVNAKEFEDMLDAIEQGEVRNIDGEIAIYTNLINQLYKELNIQVDSNKMNNLPSDAQVKFYHEILQRTGGKPDGRILNDRAKLTAFITKHQKESILCKCSVCKNGDIKIVFFQDNDENGGHQKKYFKCSNKSCKLSLSDERLDKFFASKGIDFDESEREGILKKILAKQGGYFVSGFVSKKGRTYAAHVKLVNVDNEGKSFWNLELVFDKNKKEHAGK